jgi:hypothetical protein
MPAMIMLATTFIRRRPPRISPTTVVANRVAAIEIVEELERRGTRSWISPRDVGPGQANTFGTS